MGRVIFMLEEQCMKALLDGLLPRIFPKLEFVCITHEGKKDLESSISRKLRAWREPEVRFVVVQDNDNGDCLALKQRLLQRCREGEREDTLVRIVCQELEAWYLAEPNALAVAFADEKLRSIWNRSRFRDPDAIPKPSDNIKQLVPSFSKNRGARIMANYLTRAGNRSNSFAALLSGIENLCERAGIDTGADTLIQPPDEPPQGAIVHQLPLI